MSEDQAGGTDAAKVERFDDDGNPVDEKLAMADKAARLEAAKIEAAQKARGLGEEAGSYLIRLTLRKAHPAAGTAPELEPLEGAIEAAMLTRYPDFSPSAHAERLDK